MSIPWGFHEMAPPLANMSSTSQNGCGTLSNRLPRRRVQSVANLMLRVGEMDDRGTQGDVPPPGGPAARGDHGVAGKCHGDAGGASGVRIVAIQG
jgi:hypothetical protein